MASLHYLPPVKPSAVALGTIFTHTTNLAVMAPIFGDAYHKAMSANSKQEWAKSKEAAKTATLWGSNVLGSGAQTYAVAALLTQTGVLTYKGAAYVGALIFAATSVPTMVSQLFDKDRQAEYIAIRAAAGLVETVGLSVFLTWWGIRPAHDLLR